MNAFASTQLASRSELVGRVVVAAIQAAAVYGLSRAIDQPLSWPATDKALFAPLGLICLITPLIFQLGWHQLDWKKLLAWCLAASVAIFATAHHDALRNLYAWPQATGAWWPSAQLVFALAASLFVAHVLAVNALSKGKQIDAYAWHFDLAWRVALQLCLTAGFVGLLWGILHLGSALLGLVKITFFAELLSKRWFAIPVTTLGMACAIQLLDLKPEWIRAVRGLILGLYAALLPLLALIALVFLLRLPFVSLDTLWKTRFASELTLGTALWLVVLVNSLFQDGKVLSDKKTFMRLSAALACFELVPLTLLSAEALRMRIEQYGWTVDRVYAAAVIVMAAGYAIGYPLAVLKDRRRFHGMQRTNVWMACVFVVLVLVFFTGTLDPARIMVADQVHRLERGRMAPDKFDYFALKEKGATWGTEALRNLSQPGGAVKDERVMKLASLALTARYRYEWEQARQGSATPADMPSIATLVPSGQAWPKGFYLDVFGPGSTGHGWSGVTCPIDAPTKCLARYVAIPGVQNAVLMVTDNSGDTSLFQADPLGHWRRVAWLDGAASCGRLIKGIAEGDIHAEAPFWPDLVIAGQRFAVRRVQEAVAPVKPCPAQAASK